MDKDYRVIIHGCENYNGVIRLLQKNPYEQPVIAKEYRVIIHGCENYNGVIRLLQKNSYEQPAMGKDYRVCFRWLN